MARNTRRSRERYFKFFRICSDPLRDPRFHTVSVVFSGKGDGRLRADSDAKSVKIFQADSLPNKIAFDHRKIIKDFFLNQKQPL